MQEVTGFTSGHETCHHRIYSLSCEAYESLLARAGGNCELCGVKADSLRKGKLHIDHEHRIGAHAVRGLLCPACNAAMRRVDSGERSMTWDVARYLLLSGHVLPPGCPRGAVDDPSVVRTMRISQDSWDELGDVAKYFGTTRTDLLVSFMRWANGEPGVSLRRAPKWWRAARDRQGVAR